MVRDFDTTRFFMAVLQLKYIPMVYLDLHCFRNPLLYF